MSADNVRAPHDTVAKTPFWRRRQFWNIAFPSVGLLALFVAGLWILDATVGSNGTKNSATGWGVTYATPKPPKTVKLEAAAVRTMTKFVNTAVARKNLDIAYQISGPHVREGMTLKQFLTGNIAVVPYNVKKSTVAKLKIDKSYKNKAQLEVYLTTPGTKGSDFFVDLIKTDGKWFVDGWVPRGTPPIPVTGG